MKVAGDEIDRGDNTARQWTTAAVIKEPVR
jgi:hypothetical protein